MGEDDGLAPFIDVINEELGIALELSGFTSSLAREDTSEPCTTPFSDGLLILIVSGFLKDLVDCVARDDVGSSGKVGGIRKVSCASSFPPSAICDGSILGTLKLAVGKVASDFLDKRC